MAWGLGGYNSRNYHSGDSVWADVDMAENDGVGVQTIMGIHSWSDSERFLCNRCDGKWESLLNQIKLVPRNGPWSGSVITLGPDWPVLCCPHCASTDFLRIAHLSGCNKVEQWIGFSNIPSSRAAYNLMAKSAITTEIVCVNGCPLKDWNLNG